MALTAKEIEAIKLVGKLLRKMNVGVTLTWEEPILNDQNEREIDEREEHVPSYAEPDPCLRSYTFFERLKMIEKNGVWFDRSGNKRVWPKDRKG